MYRSLALTILLAAGAMAHPASLMLGRPTANSITISVLVDRDTEGRAEYGVRAGDYPAKTPLQRFTAGQPVEVLLDPLQPDTRCFYRVRLGDTVTDEGSFHTQRAPGSTRRRGTGP